METDKKITGEEAVTYIKDGMILGLGSGSTVNWMLEKLAERIKNEGLQVKGIPTSKKTERLAKKLGISLIDFTEVERIDLAIDGADEVDPNLNLLKGGGGSLVREKIVDVLADKLIITVDGSKMVPHLGDFPLPIEVVPYGWNITAKRIAVFGCEPVIRKQDEEVFISDNGNYILDCKFEKILDPKKLHQHLKAIVGVVETGLFVGVTDKVISCRSGSMEVLERNIQELDEEE